jgi:Tol biopolymer transport system component
VRVSDKPQADLAHRLQRFLGRGYEVTKELTGAGMSRVFVAREVALGRDVVVKVLPPELGAGVNIERFRREIQLAARLQHPHIVPVLATGAKNDLLYYTMPLIEGETLRARIGRAGELPFGEAIRILRDVADALEYAHAHNVLHRDIKPNNILISGHHALVTDFGVAKALSAATDQANVTSAGVALGTPMYMSPEQAAGDPAADHRTDIYALGVVGYEMLAGRPPFQGGNAQHIISAHLTQQPVDVSHYRPSTPAALNDLIMRCLEKQPTDRFQTAEQLREQLETIAHTVSGSATTHSLATRWAPSRQWAQRRNVGLAAIAALLLAVTLIASRYLTNNRPTFEVVATTQITNAPGIEITPALSPDRRTLAYAAGEPGKMSIFVRQISGGDAIRLASGLAPQWSPDGSRLVYVDAAGIATVPSFGGTPQRLVSNPLNYLNISPVWSHDGKYLAYAQVLANGTNGSLWIADADGTNARKILDAAEPHSLSWSPQDDRLALVEGNIRLVYSPVQFGNIAPSGLWIVSRDGTGATAVTDSIHHSFSPTWSADGDGIFYVSNIRGGNDLYYQRVSGHRANGEPQRLTTGLKIHGISAAGGDRIAYSAWTTNVGIWSIPFPRAGSVSILAAHQVTAANETIEVVKLSPDGQWLAFDSDRSGNMDIYKMRINGTELQRLTRNTADDFRPTWSPDGREISFHTWRSGNRDSYAMASDGSNERIIASGPAHEWGGVWSPDGSQLALESDRSGQIEIYVAPARGGNLRRLTYDGGSGPRWSPDGKFIAYTNGALNTLTAGVAASALRVIPAEGGKSKTIMTPAAIGRGAIVQKWSNDGKDLYVESTAPDGTPIVARMALDGRSGSVLVRFDDRTRQPFIPGFTTDEKMIYFILGRHEADIWVMEIRKK